MLEGTLFLVRSYHIQNSAYLQLEASLKDCWPWKTIMYIQNPGIFRTVYSIHFKDFYVYSRMLMHIQSHSQAQRGGLKVPWFWKERSWLCPSLGKIFQCFFQNVVLRVFRRNISKIFPCRASFSCVFEKMFIELS